jgi:ribose transport system substrate-binding protein
MIQKTAAAFPRITEKATNPQVLKQKGDLMKKNYLSILLAGAMTVTMLAGCGSSSSGSDASSSAGTASASAAGGNAVSSSAASSSAASSDTGETYHVGVVLKTTSSEYWKYVIAGIDQAEKDLGNITVDVKGATSDTAFDEQQNMVETVVASDSVQALAVAPLQSSAINTIAQSSSMPIIAVDTNFDAAKTFIGTAHEDAAYQGGKYVAEKIGKGGKVVILANIQGEATSEARVSGYRKALEEGGCDILATQYTDGVGDKAVTVTDGVLQTYPDLDAIVCCADDVALGASRAIKSAGRENDGIVVCGFDGISSGVQAVIDGEITCTVAQDPYNMGYQTVVTLEDILKGKSVDSFIDTGCSVITSDNAKDYLKKLNGLIS